MKSACIFATRRQIITSVGLDLFNLEEIYYSNLLGSNLKLQFYGTMNLKKNRTLNLLNFFFFWQLIDDLWIEATRRTAATSNLNGNYVNQILLSSKGNYLLFAAVL